MRRFELDTAHFRARVLQDCLAEATSAYWTRRAESFEAVLSRPSDYIGSASLGQVAERDQRAKQTATACRLRAALSMGQADSPEVGQALEEIA